MDRSLKMSQDIVRAVTVLTERLVTLASQDDGLWENLRALARAVLLATERSPLPLTPEPSSQFAGGGEPGRQGPELLRPRHRRWLGPPGPGDRSPGPGQ